MSTKPTEKFALRDSDKHSDTWLRLRRHLIDRVESLRTELENTDEGAAAAKVRGALREVRILLALDSNPPPG